MKIKKYLSERLSGKPNKSWKILVAYVVADIILLTVMFIIFIPVVIYGWLDERINKFNNQLADENFRESVIHQIIEKAFQQEYMKLSEKEIKASDTLNKLAKDMPVEEIGKDHGKDVNRYYNLKLELIEKRKKALKSKIFNSKYWVYGWTYNRLEKMVKKQLVKTGWDLGDIS